MNIRIDHSQSVDRDVWDAYVLAHPDADHYHLSGWGRLIERVYGYEALYLSAWTGSAVVGVLPIIVANRYVTFGGYSHYALQASLASVMVVIGVISLINSRNVQFAVAAVLILLAVLTQHTASLRVLH